MNTILVTGATGNVGRPLVAHLLAAGAHVVALTRQPMKAALPDEVELITDAQAVLPRCSAAFLNSRALGPQLQQVVALAERHRIGRLVALSAINADDPDDRQPSRIRGDRNREVDELTVASGVPWVSLRPSVFASNFIGMWAAQLRAGDVVRGPLPEATAAPIADSDIAAVAARALRDDALLGRRVPLTGPQRLSNTEALAVIGEVLGRRLVYEQVGLDAMRQRFVGLGFPPAFAEAYLRMQATTLDHPAAVTTDVADILGRPAVTFEQWVTAHRAAFAKAA